MNSYSAPTIEAVTQRVEMIEGVLQIPLALAALAIVAYSIWLMKSYQKRSDAFVLRNDLPAYWRYSRLSIIGMGCTFLPFAVMQAILNAIRMIVPNNPGMFWGAVSMTAMFSTLLVIFAAVIFSTAADLAAGFDARKKTRFARKAAIAFENRRAKLMAQTPLNAQGANN